MEKVIRRVVIVVYTRVTSEFVRARKAFLARGISADEWFFASMGSYVSRLRMIS
jgi:hypothetical protein